MKEFMIVENRILGEHEIEIDKKLKEGWEIVASGQYIDTQRYTDIYWTHMTKELPISQDKIKDGLIMERGL